MWPGVHTGWTLQIWAKFTLWPISGNILQFSQPPGLACGFQWCWQSAQLISRERHPGLRKRTETPFSSAKMPAHSRELNFWPILQIAPELEFQHQTPASYVCTHLQGSVWGGEGDFRQNRSRSKHFQVQLVTCWYLSVFLYSINFRYML